MTSIQSAEAREANILDVRVLCVSQVQWKGQHLLAHQLRCLKANIAAEVLLSESVLVFSIESREECLLNNILTAYVLHY